MNTSVRWRIANGQHTLCSVYFSELWRAYKDALTAYERRLHDASLALIQGESHLFGWIAEAGAFIAALAGDVERAGTA